MLDKKEDFTVTFTDLVERIGGASSAAKITGKSTRQIQRYCSSEQEPPFSTVAKVAEAANTPLSVFSPENSTSFLSSSGESFVSVPIMNVAASAGDGSFVETEEVTDVMRFNEAWLRTTFHINPNNISIHPINGDSMEPTIMSGQLVLVERVDPCSQPTDGIYFVRVEDTIMVKRLQFLPGKKINFSCDNKMYNDFTISADDTVDFEIIGRIKIGLRPL